MNDFQSILDEIFPFVERLLKEYGEFYPISAVVNIEQKVKHIIIEEDEENDFPQSTSIITELKKELRWRKNEFLAVAIFYDVKLKEEQTDAIAVFVEHKKEMEAYTFYYPYELNDNDLIFGKSWKVIEKMQIFVN
ncbi:hypothetical protein SAMN05444397_108130 [Flavobacterium aquidurense]|uniref:Uncharacterized protein n=1 Tax=Flavobacterium frigidimaris TaxID=262320 RepID=A0ABX4BPL3_FLAFR|nr:hypothetical protein [Flavobacterium frigidimaris]OXA78843.1 hypothetical protein B0A65_11650 [Flavobacterium frigidimaris]SDZ52472.1 hypothetical protein SAMN05444397_108130 [Flavobacterium aquidurense]